jgi:exosortase/archaeosortase family protein
MQVVSALTVEVAGGLGMPVLQQGNVLHLATGTVKVEEACSGIRSLQSSLMIALFFGEFYRLNLFNRSILLIGGLAIAFATNLTRTLILVWHASNSGTEAIEKWHDTTGMSIVLVCFAGLWALGGLLQRGRKTEVGDQKSEVGGRGSETGDQSTMVADHTSEIGMSQACSPASGGPASDLRPPTSDLRPPSSVLRPPFLLSCWLLLVVVANEGWYLAHEWSKPLPPPAWTIRLPEDLPDAESMPEAELYPEMLRYDEGLGYSWRTPTGHKWGLFFFRWEGGATSSMVRAREHRPEICLTGGGWNLESVHGLQHYQAGNLRLPFQTYLFQSKGVPLHVFFCLYEDGAEAMPEFGPAWSIRDSLASIRRGQRRLGQQSLEIVVEGYPSFDAADRAFRELLPRWIVVKEREEDP